MILRSVSLCLVLVFVFGLLVIAQQMPSGATLRGRFVYEDTGLPLRRTWVGLTPIRKFRVSASDDGDNTTAANHSYSNSNGGGEEDGLVLTGDNGEFVLKDVEPGVYFAFAQQSGIYNPDTAEVEDSSFRQITVVGNETIDVDFAVRRGAAIEGRVAYQDGSPALGVSVFLMRAGKTDEESPASGFKDEKGSNVKTDDRGVYRFAGLKGGQYYVYVSEPVIHTDRSKPQWFGQLEQNVRQSILKVFYPQNYSKTDAAQVSIQFGQEHPNVDIVIPNHPFAGLSGVVVSAKDKTPVAGYQVSFDLQDEESGYDTYGARTTITDEYGRWSFRDLLPGKYEVEASRESEYRYVGEKEESETLVTKYASMSKAIEIVEGIENTVVFELAVAASISGTIEFEGKLPERGYSYVYVTANDPETGKTDSAFVPGLGEIQGDVNFVLNDLPVGNFRLRVSTLNGPYVRSITLNGDDILSTGIKLSEGESVEGVRILLGTDFGTLEGRVTNPVVPKDRFVYLSPVEYSSANRGDSIGIDDIKPDGKFRIRMKPGRYYLVTREFEYKGEISTPAEDRKAWEEWVKGAEIVELKPHETTKVTITLD